MNEKYVCERLAAEALTLTELQQLQNKEQQLLMPSVISEVVENAITQKIKRMQAVPEEAWPWLTYWLIKENKSQQGIGIIGSKFLPDEEGYVELGYAIAEEEQKKGYMTEALEGFLDWLYTFPFCSGARLSIRGENMPSVKVAENCGFYCKEIKDGYLIYQYDF